MTEELDVLKIISERLESSRVPFMLTGSFALGHYVHLASGIKVDLIVANTPGRYGRLAVPQGVGTKVGCGGNAG